MEDNETYEDKVVKAEYTYESLKDKVHDQDERIKLLEPCIKEAMFHTEGYTIRVYDMRFVSNMERILWKVDINEN